MPFFGKFKRTSKFNSKPTTVDGHRFPSKLEAKFYEKLQLLKTSGEVSYFLQQVPIRLSGGIKYFVDFLIFYADGSYEYVEIKGKETQRFIMIKKMMAELYPQIDLVVLKKGDF